MCRPCYLGFAPPTTKVSLEILVFEEIQRLAAHTPHPYIWSEPTSWDCAALPGLAYKPDHLWAFGKQGGIFPTAGAYKIDRDLIGHVIVLEIREEGIKQHTQARSHTSREAEIRGVFHPHPVDFLYVVVANCSYNLSHPDDRFFNKNDGDPFEVVPSRAAAWTARIQATLTCLEAMYREKRGTTVFIGH
jgi:hypothetical protein